LPIRPLHNEIEILSKVALGDARAFTCLFDAYYKQLGQYVYRLTESVEAAEEIVQDVFVKIWSRRQDLAGMDSFTNYLFIITRNRTYRFLKEKASAYLRQQEWEKQYQQELNLPVDTTWEHVSLMIDNLIEKLPPQQRRVYELSRIEHFKHNEIAKILSISPETVKKHIMSANKFIKNSLSGRNEFFSVLFFAVYHHFKK